MWWILLSPAWSSTSDLSWLEKSVSKGECSSVVPALREQREQQLSATDAAWVRGLLIACQVPERARVEEELSFLCQLPDVDCRTAQAWATVGWVVEGHTEGWVLTNALADGMDTTSLSASTRKNVKRRMAALHLPPAPPLSAAAVQSLLDDHISSRKFLVDALRDAALASVPTLADPAERVQLATDTMMQRVIEQWSMARETKSYGFAVPLKDGYRQNLGSIAWLTERFAEVEAVRALVGPLNDPGLQAVLEASLTQQREIYETLVTEEDLFNEHIQGLSRIDALLPQAEAITDPVQRARAMARIHIARAMVLSSVTNPQEDLLASQAAVQAAQASGDPDLLVQAHYQMAASLLSQGDPQDIEKEFSSVFSAIRQITNPTQQTQKLIQTCRFYIDYTTDTSNTVQDNLLECFAIVQSITDPSLQSETLIKLYKLGAEFVSQGNTNSDKILVVFEQALQIAAALPNPDVRARTLATIYQLRGDTLLDLQRGEEAFASYEAGLTAAEGLTDSIERAQAKAAIEGARAQAWRRQKHHEEALKSIDAALALLADLPVDQARLTLELQLIRTLVKLQPKQAALDSYEQIFATLQAFPDPTLRALLYHKRASLYHQMNEPTAAIADYEAALVALRAVTLPDEKLSTFFRVYSDYTELIKDRPEALAAAYDQAVSFTSSILDPHLRARALIHIHHQYAQKILPTSPTEAQACYERADMVANAVTPEDMRSFILTEMYLIRAEVQGGQDGQGALRSYEQAIAAAAGIPLTWGQTDILIDLYTTQAQKQLSLSQEAEALASYQAAIHTAEQISVEQKRYLQLLPLYQKSAEILRRQSDWEAALTTYNTAIEIATKNPNTAPSLSMNLYLSRAHMLFMLQRSSDAERDVAQVLALTDSLSLSKRSKILQDIYSMQKDLLIAQGRSAELPAVQARLLAVYEAPTDQAEEAQAYKLYLGHLLAAMGRDEEAEACFEQAQSQ